MDELIEAGDSPQDVVAGASSEPSQEAPVGDAPVAKDGKKRIIRAAVAAAVALVLGVGGYVGWTVAQANAREADAIALASSTKAADDNLAELWDEMDARERIWLDPEYGLGLAGPELVATTVDNLKGWDESVVAAEKAMRDCPDDATSAAYLKIFTEIRSALQDCRTGLSKTGDMSKSIDDLDTADMAMGDGSIALNDAIGYCNTKKWSSADKSATEALKEYQQAAALYKSVRKSSGDAGLDAPLRLANAYVEIAKMQAKLAQIGRSGGVGSYNAQITKMEKAEAATGGDRIPEYEFDGGMEDAAVVADKLFEAGRVIRDHHDAAKEIALTATLALQ